MRDVSETTTTRKMAESAWSVKEILGHLIDSALNNHQRFPRLLCNPKIVFPIYIQAEFVRANAYQSQPREIA